MKVNPTSKHGVFGKIVNEYGPRNKTGIQPQSTVVEAHSSQQQSPKESNVDTDDSTKKGIAVIPVYIY